MLDFATQYRYGVAAESAIAMMLRARGNGVMPVYEKIVDTGKGPQVFLPDCSLVAPDLLVFNSEKVLWVEAKHKSAFTWHRITQKWTTGIDKRHYEHYLRVDAETPWPVWLMFLHEGGTAKDSPTGSPTGLFGNPIRYLAEHINHTSDKWASGMVYWSVDSLKLLCSLNTLHSIIDN